MPGHQHFSLPLEAGSCGQKSESFKIDTFYCSSAGRHCTFQLFFPELLTTKKPNNLNALIQ